jgi:zinc D-Ala-D-Ala dipeptidase
MRLDAWKSLFLSVLLAAFLLCGCSQQLPDDLIDIREVLPDIRFDIRYATENNFTGKVLYPEARCILRREVAEALVKVQEDLDRLKLELVIYDCYRPLSVQRKMWEIMPDENYVANPEKGSRHNRGAAVDVGLYDDYGKRVKMPTEFDDFSERAHHNYIDLPAEILVSRQNLRTMMEKHGFAALPSEWWHYDFLGWQRFPIMDIPFSDVRKPSQFGF